MSAKIDNSSIEECLRKLLCHGYQILNDKRGQGETGVDILAQNGEETYHIEVIGYKEYGPARAKDFYEVFFRAISRLNDGATHCVIALANQAKIGLSQRVKNHKEARERIGNAFPELEIWLVDVENSSYITTKWNDWLKRSI